ISETVRHVGKRPARRSRRLSRTQRTSTRAVKDPLTKTIAISNKNGGLTEGQLSKTSFDFSRSCGSDDAGRRTVSAKWRYGDTGSGLGSATTSHAPQYTRAENRSIQDLSEPMNPVEIDVRCY